MTTTPHVARLGTALIAAAAATMLVAGATVAHPESEGEHPGGCVVTVQPATVAVGQQFTVTGSFGGAQIYIVAGADASPAEDASPAATTPDGGSFSVTFTAEAGDVGEHTIWGLIEASECGDSDDLTVTAALPDTAVPAVSGQLTALAGGLLLLVAAALGTDRLTRRSR